MKPLDRLRSDERVSEVWKDPPDGWWMTVKDGFAFETAEPPYSGQHTTSELTISDLAKWLKRIQPCRCANCLGLEVDEDAIIAHARKMAGLEE